MIYIIQPKGFEQKDENASKSEDQNAVKSGAKTEVKNESKSDKACLLNTGLYELIQSAYLGFQQIKAKMLTYDLVQSKYDETLFFDQKRSLYVIVYVDDIKMFVSNHQIIDDLANYLQSIYEMTDLDDVKGYLRMKITRLSQQISIDEAILLTQAKYIRDLLARHEMKECASIATLMTEIKLKKAPDDYKCPEKELKQYQVLLDELMHLMIQIRSDIAFAISKLAQFMSNSISNHGTALKRVLRYLNGTKELEILYKKISRSIVLKTGIDSNGDENPNDDRSTHNHILFMRDDFIEGRSFKQSLMILSSTKAEYIDQASAATNVMWAREILQEINIAGIVLENKKTNNARTGPEDDKNGQMNDQTGYKDGQTGHIGGKNCW